jgi:alkylation response protein AidB-like acyl-CoA dehydrogenase
VLGGVGQGYELTRDWFVEELLMIGARTVGAAERALELAVEWAGSRVQFGSPIAGYQLIQGMLARLRRRHRHQPGARAPGGLGGRPGPFPQDVARQGALVKLAASEAAGRVVDRCVQIFGGRGYMRDYPVERLYRELRVGPDLGGHERGAAPRHRQRDGQAGHRRPAPYRGLSDVDGGHLVEG